MTDFIHDAAKDKRRRLLQAGVGATVLGAIPGAIQLAHGQGAFDWKKFKGEKIEVFLVKSPRGDLLTKYHKEFEDLTGISVGSEMIPEQQQRQKAVIEFNSGNPSFDVIALSYHVQKRQFAKNNWLTDLRPMINDKSLASPELDFGDFAQGGLNYAVEAGKMYQTLLGKYGPPGVAGFNWNESQSLFLQGKAAMWLDGIGFAQPLEDPTKSRIVGKVGYGVMPAGPKKQVSALFGDGEGISAYSKKKGPAWFYLQWASNKGNQTRMLQAAAGAPVRNSAYAAAQSSGDFKAPKQWVECMLASAKIAEPGLQVIVPVTEFRDTFGVALTNMINGADPAGELKKATAEFQHVLDKSEQA